MDRVNPHDGRGIIRYRLHGVEQEWCVGAHPMKDNADTLRAHLQKWMPEAEFISATIEIVAHDERGQTLANATRYRCAGRRRVDRIMWPMMRLLVMNLWIRWREWWTWLRATRDVMMSADWRIRHL